MANGYGGAAELQAASAATVCMTVAEYVRSHLPANMVFEVTIPRSGAAADAFVRRGWATVLADVNAVLTESLLSWVIVLVWTIAGALTLIGSLVAAGHDVIGFGAGEPDFPTPAHIVQAAIEAAPQPKNHRYTPAGGLAELKEAVAVKTAKDSGYEVAA